MTHTIVSKELDSAIKKAVIRYAKEEEWDRVLGVNDDDLMISSVKEFVSQEFHIDNLETEYLLDLVSLAASTYLSREIEEKLEQEAKKSLIN